jgi:hypothetical protein
MLHPCFYNDRSARANGSNDELASSYFTQRKVTQQFNVDGIVSPAEVTSWHRPLEFYVQAFGERRLPPHQSQRAAPNTRADREQPVVGRPLPATAFLLLVATKHS